MKGLVQTVFLLLLAPMAYASGITGSSGNELLYIYILLFSFVALLLGADKLYKFIKRKIGDWRFKRKYPELEDIV
jgi:predicted ABC-type exoprotein transport system permease subunit